MFYFLAAMAKHPLPFVRHLLDRTFSKQPSLWDAQAEAKNEGQKKLIHHGIPGQGIRRLAFGDLRLCIGGIRVARPSMNGIWGVVVKVFEGEKEQRKHESPRTREAPMFRGSKSVGWCPRQDLNLYDVTH